MDAQTIIKIILIGIALSMDAFAVSVTDGLTYTDINKRKSFFIAGVFGLMQALMPLTGYWLVEGINAIVGQASSQKAGSIMSTVVTCIAFALLLFIGGKMLIGGIKDTKKPLEERKPKSFSVKEVLLFGVATSIDALGAGVALHSGISGNVTIFIHVTIILSITFVFSLVGLFLGNRIEKILKGRYEITQIIGGSILLLLAVWILLSHFLGI